MTSVIIAAHNEAAVIGRCLTSLRSVAAGLDLVVVPNGCTDRTAEEARRFGARVVEVPVASKSAALNAGDAAACSYPRLYLDADIVVPPGGVEALVEALGAPGQPLAAVPMRHLEVVGRPLLVRAYFAVNGRLPVYERSLFGRGLIALSAEGRARFGVFPDLVADDLFLDSLFRDDERVAVATVTVSVATPLRTSDLVRRLVRVRRGNAAMRRAGGRGAVGGMRAADRMAWWRDVVRPDPALWPAGVVYAAMTSYAALVARLTAGSTSWGRDESTRGGEPPGAAARIPSGRPPC